MRIEKNQPNSAIESIRPRKNRLKMFLTLILAVLILVVIPFVFLGVTGLYKIPVVSDIFRTAEAKDLGIESSDAALSSLQDKVPTRLVGNIADFCLLCQRNFEGEVKLDTSMTSEEITSFLNKYFNNDEIVSGLQVKMVEGGLEIAANLKKPVKIPVYVKVGVESSGSQSITLIIEEAKVGLFTVPKGYQEKFKNWAEKTINKRMTEINGFSLEKLEYHEGYGDFVGTLPAKVTPASGKWLKI
ncbi:MAG: hypothetical protein ABIH38_02035 [Patescibacteria group bacterium]